ncbi:zf-ZPR1-domain-containing protein [Gymnopilus junonius]|uniref:Zf-ZPR1-domain-containing protein n=1 Tax=Gymnopilus junonius TaxID=109634 RepID=A0A9P5NFP5_GYMJU|nr:zf-ZPR1-domain-containing protein [Gymnopilus junonius]
MSTKDNLFPNIGEIAAQTEEIERKPDSEGEATTGASETEEKAVQEVESLCMKCGEQGVTRLMLTSIPFFREVIVMSFRCEHCGWTNNEIQSAGEIRPEGTVYTAKIQDRNDLNRQIVRSASCELVIPELDLTLPPTSRGQLTTVEGLIRDVVADLSMDQPLRRVQDEESYKKIQSLVDKLKEILGDEEDEEEAKGGLQQPKKLRIPSLLCLPSRFIEFIGSMADPKWNLRTYHRTLDQNIDLGLVSADDEKARMAAMKQAIAVDAEGGETNQPISDDEVLAFPGLCSSCGHHIITFMKKVNIPYFKDILIMSTNCEHCGYRDNEVKSGAAISAQAKKITLKCEDREDLSRDILKSETAGLTIPEIDLVLTLEGILDQIYEELAEKAFAGDSSDKEDREKFENFLKGLKEVKNAERPFTIILDDPLANSYIQNLYAPDPDPNMTIEWYYRSFEQNEELENDEKKEAKVEKV